MVYNNFYCTEIDLTKIKMKNFCKMKRNVIGIENTQFLLSNLIFSIVYEPFLYLIS